MKDVILRTEIEHQNEDVPGAQLLSPPTPGENVPLVETENKTTTPTIVAIQEHSTAAVRLHKIATNDPNHSETSPIAQEDLQMTDTLHGIEAPKRIILRPSATDVKTKDTLQQNVELSIRGSFEARTNPRTTTIPTHCT